jgi:hypothetical protein
VHLPAPMPPYAGFFLPKQVLSEVFRGKFTDGLKCLFRRKKLTFMGPHSGFRSHAPLLASSTNCTGMTGWFTSRTLRRPGARAVLPGGLYPLGAISNHRLIGMENGRERDFPLERLCPRRQAAQDDVSGRRVHPALPAACLTERFRAHPPLRLDGQPPTGAGSPVPGVARPSGAAIRDDATQLSTQLAVSVLRRCGGSHRDDHPSRVVTFSAQLKTCTRLLVAKSFSWLVTRAEEPGSRRCARPIAPSPTPGSGPPSTANPLLQVTLHPH